MEGRPHTSFIVTIPAHLFVYPNHQPDFYTNPLVRGPYKSFDLFNFTTSWSNAATAVAKSINLGRKGAPTFQMPTYAAAPGLSNPWIWSATNTLASGIFESEVAKYISTFAMHLYPVSGIKERWREKALPQANPSADPHTFQSRRPSILESPRPTLPPDRG